VSAPIRHATVTLIVPSTEEGHGMSISEYLRAIARGWWMVAIAVIVGASAAAAFIATTPPTYAGSVTFFVNTTPGTGVSPLQSDQYAQQRVATYVRLVSSDRLARLIAADTHIDQSPQQIAASISGESPLNTVLLTATVQGASRSDVAAVTNSVSTQFVKMIRSIDPTVSLEVTSGPTVLPAPIAPRKNLDLGVGILAGLVIGSGAAILRQTLHATARSAAALSAVGGTAVLGWIANDPAVRKGSVVIDATTRSARTEAFRKLRTNLQFPGATERGSVVVVTSSDYGEGRSTTAANLAVICAEAGKKTLLVDGDLRRPRIADYLDVKRAPGLAEVLAAEASFDDSVQPSSTKGMLVLASGFVPPNPAELLGSQAMTDLLIDLRRRFDIVIVDSPPLLPVTDAAVAASQSDGAIVVVRYGRTRLAHVASAIGALESANARVLGCVVTMAPRKGAGAKRAQDAMEFSSVRPQGVGISSSDPESEADVDQDLDERAQPLLDDEIAT
jgi:capsular exopolysaccharide synthesis family protein